MYPTLPGTVNSSRHLTIIHSHWLRKDVEHIAVNARQRTILKSHLTSFQASAQRTRKASAIKVWMHANLISKGSNAMRGVFRSHL